MCLIGLCEDGLFPVAIEVLVWDDGTAHGVSASGTALHLRGPVGLAGDRVVARCPGQRFPLVFLRAVPGVFFPVERSEVSIWESSFLWL